MPSPDGTLVAYMSYESRTTELYVQRFPTGGERLVVSKGARLPDAGRTSDVRPGGVGPNTSNYAFDVTADGRIIVAEEVRGSFDLVLVRNGLTTLRGK